LGRRRYRLAASQVLPLPPEHVFPFFEDPRNLFEITPDWLDFRMMDPGQSAVFEGAEFGYTIRWLGIRIRWRSRITDYRPPNRFADIQLIGPYRSWHHVHTFERVPQGTLMRDEVTYELPFGAGLLHPWVIRPQLRAIFTYRARRVAEWSGGTVARKGC
jgi:ligand-binding SRPBCC domain-containing protein